MIAKWKFQDHSYLDDARRCVLMVFFAGYSKLCLLQIWILATHKILKIIASTLEMNMVSGLIFHQPRFPRNSRGFTFPNATFLGAQAGSWGRIPSKWKDYLLGVEHTPSLNANGTYAMLCLQKRHLNNKSKAENCPDVIGCPISKGHSFIIKVANLLGKKLGKWPSNPPFTFCEVDTLVPKRLTNHWATSWKVFQLLSLTDFFPNQPQDGAPRLQNDAKWRPYRWP